MFVHFFEKCPLYESNWIILCDLIYGVVNICRQNRPKKCLIQPILANYSRKFSYLQMNASIQQSSYELPNCY